MEKLTFIRLLFKMHIPTKSKERIDLFKRFGFYNTSLVKLVVLLYTGAAASFFPYPLYMYYFKDQLVPLILLYVPYVNENTASGYICLLLLHTFVLVLAVIGMGVCDILVALCIINIPIFARLIEDEVDQLNEILSKSAENARTWKYRLRNMFAMHQEMATWVCCALSYVFLFAENSICCRFLSETDEMFHKITIAQIGSCMVSSIPVVYVVLMVI